MGQTFSSEQFILDCKQALQENLPQQAVLELVTRAIAEPGSIVHALGEPDNAGIKTLYRDDDLTILNLTWGPEMVLKPHNHEMWAVIGIYGGCEENTFYRRDGNTLRQHGMKQLNAKDAVPLGNSIIHGVRNPLQKLTAGIHVYGGDFFDTPRSEWDPESLEEKPYSVEDTKRVFEESNKKLQRFKEQS